MQKAATLASANGLMQKWKYKTARFVRDLKRPAQIAIATAALAIASYLVFTKFAVREVCENRTLVLKAPSGAIAPLIDGRGKRIPCR